MDLRKEFDEMITSYGHAVLIQRSSRKIRCDCWNEKYQEALSSCPFCLGQGWVNRIEKHHIRRQTATDIISLPGRTQNTPVGRLLTDTRTFFMKHDVRIKEGDMIYECGWHKDKPTHIITSYEASYIDDMRGDNGRIEFYQVSVREKTSPLTVDKIRLRRIGPVINYELYKGGVADEHD